MIVLTKINIPDMDKREALKADNFDLLLSTKNWKWQALGLPLNIDTLRYRKRK